MGKDKNHQRERDQELANLEAMKDFANLQREKAADGNGTGEEPVTEVVVAAPSENGHEEPGATAAVIAAATVIQIDEAARNGDGTDQVVPPASPPAEPRLEDSQRGWISQRQADAHVKVVRSYYKEKVIAPLEKKLKEAEQRLADIFDEAEKLEADLQAELKVKDKRITELENQLKSLKEGITVMAGKKTLYELKKLDIPELEKLRDDALRARDFAYAGEIVGVIDAKNNPSEEDQIKDLVEEVNASIEDQNQTGEYVSEIDAVLTEVQGQLDPLQPGSTIEKLQTQVSDVKANAATALAGVTDLKKHFEKDGMIDGLNKELADAKKMAEDAQTAAAEADKKATDATKDAKHANGVNWATIGGFVLLVLVVLVFMFVS